MKYAKKYYLDTEGKYRATESVADYTYPAEFVTLFPRMWSTNPSHIEGYKQWSQMDKGKTVFYKGERYEVPTGAQNLRYFFSYQMNFMYWRYFLWNFVGRQSDNQSYGEITDGQWLSGIGPIDQLYLGPQKELPSEMADNKGRNKYYFLPFILGIIGLIYQLNRDPKNFTVVMWLFVMMGIALVFYFNQTPSEPRERDYIYAGSFYAFSIWIGLGVMCVREWVGKLTRKDNVATSAIATAVCCCVPAILAAQNWDDHDRSGRYVCRDFGMNYLSSVDENGIIFTNGDNDTFPLWYNQETEGFRTDVRVCNLSYLQTDWYIDQMKRQAYDSPAVPIEWSRLEYVQGHNEGVAVRPEVMESINNFYKQNPEEAAKEFGDNPYELKNILKYWVRSPKEGLQLIPTDSIVIKLDKEAVKRSGMMIPDSLHGEIPDYMSISLKGKRMLYKSELMMLEMLANTNWERPLYMAITVGSDNHLNLGNNFMQEGLAYRITPFNTTALNARIDSEKMYDNLMNKFKFGGIDNPNIYIDETVMRMCLTHRRMFIQLASQLIKEGKKDKALEVLDYSLKVIPSTTVPHDYIMSSSKEMADDYLALGETEKAEAILSDLANKAVEYISWYLSLDDQRLANSYEECVRNFYILDELNKTLARCNTASGVESESEQKPKSDMSAHYVKKFEELYEVFNNRVGGKRK